MFRGAHLTIVRVCSLAAAVANLAAEKPLLEVLVEVVFDAPEASLQRKLLIHNRQTEAREAQGFVNSTRRAMTWTLHHPGIALQQGYGLTAAKVAVLA